MTSVIVRDKDACEFVRSVFDAFDDIVRDFSGVDDDRFFVKFVFDDVTV